MNDWLVFQGDNGLMPPNIPIMVIGLLLGFLLGQTMAWVYMLTHSGLSYSRTFVNALVVTPVIVSLVMTVLANNIVSAFGLLAVFAIVRFRNILRDTLDTSYLLLVIFAGMACGTQKFTTAVVGSLAACSVLIYLWFTKFGTRHRFDLILNLHWARPATDRPRLEALLFRHSRAVQLASQRTQPGYTGADLSFRLLLRDNRRTEGLIDELQRLEGVSQVTSLRAEDESEL